MGMLEDDLQRPDKPCGKCGSRNHWERDCFMNSRAIDTATLGPVKVEGPSASAQRARVVKEALEAAAVAEPDPMVRRSLEIVARAAGTDTLAYIGRLLR